MSARMFVNPIQFANWKIFSEPYVKFRELIRTVSATLNPLQSVRAQNKRLPPHNQCLLPLRKLYK